jgi:hypothetical protein
MAILKDGVYFEGSEWVAYSLGNELGSFDTEAEALESYNRFEAELDLCG